MSRKPHREGVENGSLTTIQPYAVDERLGGGFPNLSLKAEALKTIRHPLSARDTVFMKRRVGAHTREGSKFPPLPEEPLMVHLSDFGFVSTYRETNLPLLP